MLCDPNRVVWGSCSSFEVMTCRTAFIIRSPVSFPMLSSAIRQMTGHSCTVPAFTSLSSLADRIDWLYNRVKRPLARKLDLTWWHRHTNIKLFSHRQWLSELHGLSPSWGFRKCSSAVIKIYALPHGFTSYFKRWPLARKPDWSLWQDCGDSVTYCICLYHIFGNKYRVLRRLQSTLSITKYNDF